MLTAISVQDLKIGDYVNGEGFVHGLNTHADEQANLATAKKESRFTKFDKEKYAGQVKFEEQFQYKTTNSARVSVRYADRTKTYDSTDIVSIYPKAEAA